MDEPPREGEPEASAQYSTADLMMAGVAAQEAGNLDTAFAIFETVAMRGNIDSMIQAGLVASRLGRADAADYWTRQAADNGSPLAVYNLGIQAFEAGRVEEALSLLVQAAQGENFRAFPVIVEILRRTGRDGDAREWAALGAELDEPGCLQAFGNFLLTDEPPDTTDAEQYIERSAELGNVNAMVQAGLNAYRFHQDRDRARTWLVRATEAGDTEAPSIIERLGL